MGGFSRRGFLKGAGATAVGIAIAGGTAHAEAKGGSARDAGRTVLPYPRHALGNAGQLKEGSPVEFTFPDNASPCVLIKNAGAVAGGVGPDRSITAFSTVCTHMGCPVEYQPRSSTFKCPCHFTTFDAEKGGQLICGQATENLPQVVLEYDEKTDSLYAVAIHGLLYGRQSNIL